MERAASIGVAVVGLGFGAEFAPIYRDHPSVDYVVICDENDDLVGRTKAVAKPDGVAARFEDVLADPRVDAVHLEVPPEP